MDVAPRTVPYKEVKNKKPPGAPAIANGDSSMIEAGQTTLDDKRPLLNGTNGVGGHDGGMDDDDDAATVADPNVQLEMESRGAEGPGVHAMSVNGQLVNEDVEMRG